MRNVEVKKRIKVGRIKARTIRVGRIVAKGVLLGCKSKVEDKKK